MKSLVNIYITMVTMGEGLFFKIIYMAILLACVCLCTTCKPGVQRPEESLGYPGTGVIDGCEPHHVGVGN